MVAPVLATNFCFNRSHRHRIALIIVLNGALIMLHAQLYFLFVFDFPKMEAPYLICIYVWGQ